MKSTFLILLGIFTFFHLLDSWRDDSKKRAKTKGFLVPSIIGYYVACVYPDVSVLLLIALATSWLGDVLLIPKGNKWFTMGGISFMLSHLFFILVYASNVDFAKVNWLIVIPVAVVYYGFSVFIVSLLKPTTPKKMLVPMVIYLMFNSTMNCFAIMQLMSKPCLGTAVALMGAVLFFVSDCSLYLVRYYKKPDIVFKRHFTVMLTYILSEFLIAQGLILLK